MSNKECQAVGRFVKRLQVLLIALLSATGVSASTQAPLAAARTDMESLKTAMEAFKVECGSYPPTAEGFQALLRCPANVPPERWHGPYVQVKMVKDPWRHEFVYRCPGLHNTNGFDIYSCGRDGMSKSGGDDPDDINNWDFPKHYVAPPPEPPRIVGKLVGGALALMGLSFVAWWGRRISKSSGNLHGVAALLWVVAAFIFILTVTAIRIPVERFPPVPTSVSILLALENACDEAGFGKLFVLFAFYGWWPLGLWLAVSGLRHGCPVSKVYGVITKLAFICVLLMFVTSHIPRFAGR